MASGRVIGIYPPAERDHRLRLFQALEEAFPVRFEGRREGNWENLDALIIIDKPVAESSLKDVACFTALTENYKTDLRSGPIDFTNASELDPRLRSRSLHESRAHGLLPIPIGPEDEVLALSGGDPVWIRRRTARCLIYSVSLAPSNLSMNGTLRDHLRGGRFFDLLPLIHFLREVTSAEAWAPPPLRATFVFDDPNLHCVSYGFIDFRLLAEHAKIHNYHAAIATIPFDAWYASPRVREIFHKNDRWLSLLIHGNDHVRGELDQGHSERRVAASLAQALLRIAAFERRTGLSVSRIMVPPHGECSEFAIHQMLRLGYDGVCISRPYPWLERPPSEKLLAQWWPSDIVAGVPVFSRYSLHQHWDDIVIRAFLNQPIILYGHHSDLSGGMDILERAAEQINGLGEVSWMSLGQIARSSYATRTQGNSLRVQLLSRHVMIKKKAKEQSVLVSVGPGWEGSDQDIVKCGSLREPLTSILGESYVRIPVSETRNLEITLEHSDSIDPGSSAGSSMRLWPAMRRVMTESRDRIQPVAARVKSIV